MESCKYLSCTGICINAECPASKEFCPWDNMDDCAYAEEGACEV